MYFVDSWVPGVLLWLTLNGFRPFLTSRCHHLYQAGAKAHFEAQGHHAFQTLEAHDGLKWRRVNSLTALAGIGGVLIVVWSGARDFSFGASLYLAVLGAFTLPLCNSHLQVLHGYFAFRGALDGRSITGQITYSDEFVWHASAMSMLSFAGLCLLLAATLENSYFLGGMLGCLWVAQRQRAVANARRSR